MVVLSEVFGEFLDLKEINPKPSEQSVRRLIEVAGDLPVDQYARSHAKAFLASYSEQKTSTRRRRLQCLSSILNFAYWEYDIDKSNPFSRVIIKGEGKDATSREPFSVVELKKLYSASLAYGQLRLILPILGETGCRLSEVLGLMKQDVIHTEDLLVINIRENDCRGLKTENSKRLLPVVSDSATKALQKLLEAQSDSPYLFPRYASCGYLNNTGHQLRSVITSRSPLTVRPPTA
ncbi:tyrosine-type recombinase/integrase [Thalassobium sp. R2A62]|uniref:tyrosine-type recombinase/integrase n=1 Tax=Thalassobium sp. R2A62 TaxID=633131 RepID=UPI0001B1D701|nr:tyrosine-type recombinase/integrase [Thalassobium sp. R2A62]EET49308.1 integrase family protein, putative [Thalassobium sp. R2A62]